MIALLKDHLLRQVARFWQANLQLMLDLLVIQLEEVIMQVLMKVRVFVFLMMLQLVPDICKKKDMREGY